MLLTSQFCNLSFKNWACLRLLLVIWNALQDIKKAFSTLLKSNPKQGLIPHYVLSLLGSGWSETSNAPAAWHNFLAHRACSPTAKHTDSTTPWRRPYQGCNPWPPQFMGSYGTRLADLALAGAWPTLVKSDLRHIESETLLSIPRCGVLLWKSRLSFWCGGFLAQSVVILYNCQFELISKMILELERLDLFFLISTTLLSSNLIIIHLLSDLIQIFLSKFRYTEKKKRRLI